MNINYELAKELKDVGFPQTGKGATMISPDYSMSSGTTAVAPTLSELIEACGDILLYKLPKNNQWDSSEKGVWVASEIREYLCADTYFIDTSFTGQIGTTPEELESFFRPTLSGILQPTTPKIRISF